MSTAQRKVTQVNKSPLCVHCAGSAWCQEDWAVRKTARPKTVWAQQEAPPYLLPGQPQTSCGPDACSSSQPCLPPSPLVRTGTTCSTKSDSWNWCGLSDGTFFCYLHTHGFDKVFGTWIICYHCFVIFNSTQRKMLISGRPAVLRFTDHWPYVSAVCDTPIRIQHLVHWGFDLLQ